MLSLQVSSNNFGIKKKNNLETEMHTCLKLPKSKNYISTKILTGVIINPTLSLYIKM